MKDPLRAPQASFVIERPHGTWVMTAGYLARAVTPGSFTRPPVRAECMYDISVQGIAGSGMLTVLPGR